MEPQNLKVRTKAFALLIIRLYGLLPAGRNPKEVIAQTIGKQFLRSGTSVGANYREANRSRSNPEFVAKVGDCLKELDETIYWLELLIDSNSCPDSLVIPVLKETNELCAIFTSISKKMKSKIREEK